MFKANVETTEGTLYVSGINGGMIERAIERIKEDYEIIEIIYYNEK